MGRRKPIPTRETDLPTRKNASTKMEKEKEPHGISSPLSFSYQGYPGEIRSRKKEVRVGFLSCLERDERFPEAGFQNL